MDMDMDMDMAMPRALKNDVAAANEMVIQKMMMECAAAPMERELDRCMSSDEE